MSTYWLRAGGSAWLDELMYDTSSDANTSIEGDRWTWVTGSWVWGAPDSPAWRHLGSRPARAASLDT